MPRTADPTEIPERLFAAGLELFLSRGYNATGIQQIAARAGVPKGSFYNHFESKEAFAAAIVARYARRMERSWTRMLRDAPPRPLETIRHVFAQMCDYHERAPQPVGCLVGNFAAEIAASSDACRARLMEAQLGWRERLAGLIEQGQAEGEIRDDIDATTLSALTWSTWEGALLRMKVEGSTGPLDESVDAMLDKVYPATRPARGRRSHKAASRTQTKRIP